MKLIANNDGNICRTVALNSNAIFRMGSPASNAATIPATKTTVPGMPMKFRFTVASSGVGCGAIGGIFKTALCKYGIGVFSASKFRYLATEGKPVAKIRTEATMKGDQPFRTCPAECLLIEVAN